MEARNSDAKEQGEYVHLVKCMQNIRVRQNYKKNQSVVILKFCVLKH